MSSTGGEDKKGEEDKSLALQERKIAFDAMKFALEVGIESLRRNMQTNFSAWQLMMASISLICVGSLSLEFNYIILKLAEIKPHPRTFSSLQVSIVLALFSVVCVVLSYISASSYINDKSNRYDKYMREIKIGQDEKFYCTHVLSIVEKMGYGGSEGEGKFRKFSKYFPFASLFLWFSSVSLFFFSLVSK